MTNVILALAAVGTLYLLDAIWDALFKNDREPILRFGWWCFVAFCVKLLVKFVTWAINF
jgi:hypothetical protein